MNYATRTLVVFVAVFALNACGLALDAVLAACRLPTISEVIWHRPVLGAVIGVPIVLLQLVGAAALALHFWRPW